MRKRINLQVDKLVTKQQKKINNNFESTQKQKGLSFQQMYQMARKTSQLTHNKNILNQNYFSSTTSNITDSLKGSRITPQNSNRNGKKMAEIHQKLNRSLQTKSNSIEKDGPLNRSVSSDRKNLVEKWKTEKQAKHQKLAKAKIQQPNCQSQKGITSNQSEGKQQFKVQFDDTVRDMDHKSHQHVRETECFLSVQQTFHILRKLHYLRKLEDQKYLLKIWHQLQGETYGGIPCSNLYEFLTFINHNNSNSFYPKQEKIERNAKRIQINNNLKIVVSEKEKLQIYEQYLALRVNRILYGGSNSDFASDKKLHRTSNIKIVEEENSQQHERKKVILMTNNKMSFSKKNKKQNQKNTEHCQRRTVRLKSNGDGRTLSKAAEQKITKISEETEEKYKSQDTICYSQFSETKESAKNLTSNESQTSLHSNELIEEIVIKKPIFSIDVNIGDGLTEKLTVFEGQSAFEVSKRLVDKYHIDETLRSKFQILLKSHIRNLLWRIQQVSEQLTSDRQE